MTCKYCGQEDRYGHDALCVMNVVEDLRAEVERLRAALQDMIEISTRNSEATLMLIAIRKCAEHALEPKP